MTHSLRAIVFSLLAALALPPLALAHEGHGDEAVVAVAGLPRAETHSDLFEVVAILQPGGVLTIYVDRYTDNAPVDGAVTLTLDGQEVAAERQGIGLFVARHPLLSQPGERNVVFPKAPSDRPNIAFLVTLLCSDINPFF